MPASRCSPVPIIPEAKPDVNNSLRGTTVTYTCLDGYLLPWKAIIYFHGIFVDHTSYHFTTQYITCDLNSTSSLLEWTRLDRTSPCAPKTCLTPVDEFKKALEKDALLKRDKYIVHTIINYTCIDGRRVAAVCHHDADKYDRTLWKFPLGQCPG